MKTMTYLPPLPTKKYIVKYVRCSDVIYKIYKSSNSFRSNLRLKKNPENVIMQKRKSRLKRFIAHNQFAYFLTITLKEVKDNSYTHIKKFIRSNDFGRYIIVPELSPCTKRLHFHILIERCPFPIVEYKRKRVGKWEKGLEVKYITEFYGFTDIKPITTDFFDSQYYRVVNYLSKYLGKSPLYKNTYSRGLKKYFTYEEVIQIPRFYEKIKGEYDY